MTAPRRLPPVTRVATSPRGAPEAKLMAHRASLRDLQALAADVGLPPVFAVQWHGRRLSIGQAKADAAHRLRLRRALGEQRMCRASRRG